MKAIVIISTSTLFTGFAEVLLKLKEFYKLLSDFKNRKPATIETKNRINRVKNNVN